MELEPILEVKDLSISFTQYGRGTKQVLLPVIQDLSLTIRPGQVVAVVLFAAMGEQLRKLLDPASVHM